MPQFRKISLPSHAGGSVALPDSVQQHESPSPFEVPGEKLQTETSFAESARVETQNEPAKPEPEAPVFVAGSKPKPNKKPVMKMPANQSGTAETAKNNNSSQRDGLQTLATETIVKVTRMEMDVSGLKDQMKNQAANINSVVEYVNAVFSLTETLQAQCEALAWQSRLAELHISQMKGLKVSDDMIQQARFSHRESSDKANRKKAEADKAFKEWQEKQKKNNSVNS